MKQQQHGKKRVEIYLHTRELTQVFHKAYSTWIGYSDTKTKYDILSYKYAPVFVSFRRNGGYQTEHTANCRAFVGK